MTDKELIKQEIKRRIFKAEEFAERAEGANDDSSKLSWDFVATQNKSLLQFIDSLPEEPKKQPKFKVGDIIKGPHNNIFEIKEVLENQYVLHSKNGDELNSITIVDRSSCVVEEPASEDLEEEMIRWHKERFGNKRDWEKTSGKYLTRKSQLDLARHFAEWQKKKDQETIELAEDHAMLAGMKRMKEEMMKDAVEAFVNIYENTDDSNYVEFVTEQSPYKFKETEKCKIIIVKEE